MIRPCSKVVVKFLKIMQERCECMNLRYSPPNSIFSSAYIGDFEILDDHRGGKVIIELNGRLNKCGVISPRHNVKARNIDKCTASIIPSRKLGYVVFTSSAGIMDNKEAHAKNTGGRILGYFY